MLVYMSITYQLHMYQSVIDLNFFQHVKQLFLFLLLVNAIEFEQF